MATIIVKTPEVKDADVTLKRLQKDGTDVELKVGWKLGGRHSPASGDERNAEAARDLFAHAIVDPNVKTTER